jgi:hypothetical protein
MIADISTEADAYYVQKMNFHAKDPLLAQAFPRVGYESVSDEAHQSIPVL